MLSRMGLKDFEDDEAPLVVAKLTVEKLKGKKLVTSHVLPFRAGMPLIINPGGATKERTKVANFKPDALITADPLKHIHSAGEKVRFRGRWRRRSQGKYGRDVARANSNYPLWWRFVLLRHPPLRARCPRVCSLRLTTLMLTRFIVSWWCLQGVDTSAARCLDTGVVSDVDMKETLPQKVSYATAPECGNDHGAPPQFDVLPNLPDAMPEKLDRQLVHSASARDESTGPSTGMGDLECAGGLALCLEEPPQEIAVDDQGQLQGPREQPAAPPTPVASKSHMGNVQVKAAQVAQILGELLWHVLPAWAKPSLTMRRTQGFAIFLTSLLTSSFDLGAVFSAVWGVAVSCPFTLLFFVLFRKARRYGNFSTDEQELQVRWWIWSERLGWVLLIIVHGGIILFFVAFLRFFSLAILKKVAGRFHPVLRLHGDSVPCAQSPLFCPLHSEQVGSSRSKNLIFTGF